VSNPASLNTAQSVEHAPRAWIVLGMVALVLEGTFAILSLAVVASITLVFLTMRAAISVRALLFPRFGRLPRLDVPCARAEHGYGGGKRR
jgi:hypothetical protein